ncbi:MAG: septum formation initiator family protein [Verrucomicrobiota bacterium]
MNWQVLWQRIQSLGFVVFAGIVAAGVAVFLFVPALHRRHEMQLELQRLDSEIIRQETTEKQQRQEIESLKTDPSYVERTARNKLNLAKANEIIFRFESTQPAVLPPPPAAQKSSPHR